MPEVYVSREDQCLKYICEQGRPVSEVYVNREDQCLKYM